MMNAEASGLSWRWVAAVWLGAIAGAPVHAEATKLTAADYQADANALPALIGDNYAYLDELPGGKLPSSPQLDAERAAVRDQDTLLHYAEDMITTLSDHHALTGTSLGGRLGDRPDLRRPLDHQIRARLRRG